MRRIVAGAALLLFSLLLIRPAAARIIDFPYRDRVLLLPGQQHGGRIWLPNSARSGQTYTLVVLLHGLNQRGAMQPLLSQQRVDVAGVATRLIRAGDVRQDFIMAAPTQTLNASSSATLWYHFDLKDFIKQVHRHLPRGIRLAGRPVVMGHSGAGCSPENGLWWLARKHGGWIRAMATMDTCMTRAFGADLYKQLWPGGPKGGQTWFINFWQSGWERDIDGYEQAMHFELLQAQGPRGLLRVKRNPRRWVSAQVLRPHDKLVESIFDEALRRLFPTPRQLAELERQLAQAQRQQQQERRRAEQQARAAKRKAEQQAREAKVRAQQEARRRAAERKQTSSQPPGAAGPGRAPESGSTPAPTTPASSGAPAPAPPSSPPPAPTSSPPSAPPTAPPPTPSSSPPPAPPSNPPPAPPSNPPPAPPSSPPPDVVPSTASH